MIYESVARPVGEAAPPASRDPAQVKRLGPEAAKSLFDTGGAMLANVVANAQADAKFVRHVERLLKDYFKSGHPEQLFVLTGNESIEEEAAKLIVEHIARHILLRFVQVEGEGFLICETANGNFELFELKEPLLIRAEPLPIAEEDRLNGTEWSGRLTVAIGSIGRVLAHGRWSKWQKYSIELETYTLLRENNSWMISWSGKRRYYRPSSRQLQDALADF